MVYSAPLALLSCAIITCRSAPLLSNVAQRQFVEITFFHHRCKNARQVIAIIILWSWRRQNVVVDVVCYARRPMKGTFRRLLLRYGFQNSTQQHEVIYEHFSAAMLLLLFAFFSSRLASPVLRFSPWIFMFRATKSLFTSFHYIKGNMELPCEGSREKMEEELAQL